jgi:hypothetical protein
VQCISPITRRRRLPFPRRLGRPQRPEADLRANPTLKLSPPAAIGPRTGVKSAAGPCLRQTSDLKPPRHCAPDDRPDRSTCFVSASQDSIEPATSQPSSRRLGLDCRRCMHIKNACNSAERDAGGGRPHHERPVTAGAHREAASSPARRALALRARSSSRSFPGYYR